MAASKFLVCLCLRTVRSRHEFLRVANVVPEINYNSSLSTYMSLLSSTPASLHTFNDRRFNNRQRKGLGAHTSPCFPRRFLSLFFTSRDLIDDKQEQFFRK